MAEELESQRAAKRVKSCESEDQKEDNEPKMEEKEEVCMEAEVKALSLFPT